MYPRLSDLFELLFGIELPFPIYSYGAMVAAGIMIGTWLLARELDRKYDAGQIDGVRIDVEGETEPTEVSPSVLAGTLAVLAAVAGVFGAKLFTILGAPSAFLLDPAGMLFSTGALTFYGGLIVATGVIVWYIRQQGLNVLPVLDAVAPGVMLGYGIGRIGCHLAGDGDWGIAANMAAKPDVLPTWLWAETYPNAIAGPPAQPVYPTPIYEFLAALLLCGVLWGVRRHSHRAGWLFSLYLVFNGVERFLIEKIRVTQEYDLFGVAATQAEIISVLLFGLGLWGVQKTWERRGT